MTAQDTRILTVMQAVEEVYLNQANVKMQHVTRKNALQFNNIRLGDNLVFAEFPKPHPVFFPRTVHKTIQDKLRTSGFTNQDVNVVFTWNIRDDPGFRTLGFTPDTVAYIEDNPNLNEMISVAAHEFGHALGLPHDNHLAIDMMAEGQFNSLVFTKADIDHIIQVGRDRFKRGRAMALRSRMFLGNTRLESCLVLDSSHVTLGDRGPHVGLIQSALIILDDLFVADAELVPEIYGTSTAAAVLSYKKVRGIINRAYQSAPDSIVGKMTIASLDNDMLALQGPPTPRTPKGCTRLTLAPVTVSEVIPPRGATLAIADFKT